MRRVFLIVPVFLTLVSAVLALGSPSFAATAQTSTALVREGRWLKYNGHYQYFVGFDNQELVADTSIDYISVLDALRDARVNKVRIWLDAYWNPNYEHPWVRRNGKYDLDQWNLRYWQRLADFMTAAHHRGIIVEVTLFAVSPADPDWWGNTTFQIAWHEANNVNGAFRTNADGTFFPQFFDLDHREVSRAEER